MVGGLFVEDRTQPRHPVLVYPLTVYSPVLERTILVILEVKRMKVMFFLFTFL